jgi:hypothetical protein
MQQTRQEIMHGDQETSGTRLWREKIAPAPDTPPLAPPKYLDPMDKRTSMPTDPTTTTLKLQVPPQTNLMCTTTTPTPIHVKSLDLPNTPALIAFHHGTARYPVKQTWLAAINHRAYATWPELTYKLAAKYCPNSDATHCRHMAQPCQHIQSTRLHASTKQLPVDTPEAPNTTPTIEVQFIPINHLFTDDTSWFTPQSCSGNQYIVVAFHSESNAILVRAFQSKHDTHRIAAYQQIHNQLAAQHATPDVHILDNEASVAFCQQLQIPTGTTTRPSSKPCGESNRNLQRSLSDHPSGSGTV